MPHIDTQELIKLNTEHWALASFHPDALAKAKPVAARLVSARAKLIYEQIEADTGVPWFIVAVLHEREASQDWSKQLGQGDPLNQVSRHVPKGRGPFSSFIAGADDALINCAPKLAQWKDWSPGGALTATELYNGTGYESYHHMASPYVWGGSDIYHVGKYVADGNFSATVEDHQLGCAVLLKEMMLLDSSIQFATPAQRPVDVPIPPERPARADEGEEGEERDQPPAPAPAPVPVAPKAEEQEQPIPVLPKPVTKSKITWLSWLMSFLGLSGLTGNMQDATLDTVQQAVSTVHDKTVQVHDIANQVGLGSIFMNALHKPNTIIFLGIIVVGIAIAYFRWKDHGRGSPALTGGE